MRLKHNRCRVAHCRSVQRTKCMQYYDQNPPEGIVSFHSWRKRYKRDSLPDGRSRSMGHSTTYTRQAERTGTKAEVSRISTKPHNPHDKSWSKFGSVNKSHRGHHSPKSYVIDGRSRITDNTTSSAPLRYSQQCSFVFAKRG